MIILENLFANLEQEFALNVSLHRRQETIFRSLKKVEIERLQVTLP